MLLGAILFDPWDAAHIILGGQSSSHTWKLWDFESENYPILESFLSSKDTIRFRVACEFKDFLLLLRHTNCQEPQVRRSFCESERR